MKYFWFVRVLYITIKCHFKSNHMQVDKKINLLFILLEFMFSASFSLTFIFYVIVFMYEN